MKDIINILNINILQVVRITTGSNLYLHYQEKWILFMNLSIIIYIRVSITFFFLENNNYS